MKGGGGSNEILTLNYWPVVSSLLDHFLCDFEAEGPSYCGKGESAYMRPGKSSELPVQFSTCEVLRFSSCCWWRSNSCGIRLIYRYQCALRHTIQAWNRSITTYFRVPYNAGNCLTSWAADTRWFKYDRDKLWLVYTQIVPVIFEPPCSFSGRNLLRGVRPRYMSHVKCMYVCVWMSRIINFGRADRFSGGLCKHCIHLETTQQG